MFARLLNQLCAIACLIALVGCNQQSPSATPLNSPSPASLTVPKGKIVIADVSQTPSKKFERFQPMADYIASQLHQFGIGVGEVRIAQDFETVANWIKKGDVDIYFDSPYPAMRVKQLSGALPILRRWKNGQDSYFGIIIIRANSGIYSVKDLLGKTIAFEEPVSTSGYFLQLGYLFQSGLNVVQKQSLDKSVPANKVGYVFSEDDENTIQWVINGKVDAGATDGVLFETVPEESRKAMKILAKTDKIARNIVLIKPKMKPEQAAAIKSILINMDKTEEGKKILNIFEKTTKFDEYPVKADLDKMQQLYDRIKAQ
ncbi:phosphate/phosphite/phosphonate ABC transporter substrate-binding protein [Gloeothece verrucosa]|uniref:Putative alkylphosphonate ABC transporter n=1 Tax=Gloeothece verrucosa (strain PCC 7822) TaxID=497965 RepID=E0UHY7_GLOV7|nr:phosphate/phosphite/phosphonate ABC transporter substrate-binding protein [Gloeothece verrucosa]ADN14517.1 putative alkylphosphonate ABC transporter [Gloeothece verrucosa PCC 7822]